MPDDELDANNPLINTANDDYDEFLPSSSTAAVTSQKSLFKYEDDDDEDDEFASSLMAAAQGKIQFLIKLAYLFDCEFLKIELGVWEPLLNKDLQSGNIWRGVRSTSLL